jgi:hypothetical protein
MLSYKLKSEKNPDIEIFIDENTGETTAVLGGKKGKVYRFGKNYIEFSDPILYKGQLVGKVGYLPSSPKESKDFFDEVITTAKRLQAEKAQRDIDEYHAKLDSIEGLNELQTAINEWDDFHTAFNEYLDEECPLVMPKKPESDVAALKAKYPKAVAYLQAESWSRASHYEKAHCGREASEAILNGEDYKAAIAKMEADWSNYCHEHIWD